MNDENLKWYFCFRQVIPSPPGRWIAVGPFATYEDAMKARQRSKAWDAEVTTVFCASSKAEADEKCASGKVA